ncbi:MAG: hypothetical protein IJY90_03365 [Clostridia bacterium]|nr:hypothetical protein [Clostridia bacterium]
MAKTHVSNKKFTMTVVTLCCSFLLVIGAVIGIWAATSQSISAGFKVTYEVGTNVAAGIRTEYLVPGLDANDDGYADGAVVVTKNQAGEEVENTNGYVIFNASDNQRPVSVYIGDFELSAKTPTIEFYFTVENKLLVGFIETVLTPNYTAQENITIDISYANVSVFTATDSASIVEDSAFESTSTNIGVGEFKIIKVVASATDVNADASFAGSFTLTLNFATTA